MESTPATLGAARLALFYVPVRCALVRGHICMGQGGRHALILSVTLHRSSWVLSVHGSSAPGASGGDGGDCGTVIAGGLGEGGGGDGDGGGGEGDGGGGDGDGGLGGGGLGEGGGGDGDGG
eukprot:scaffold102158_cov51-Phaeocystis_antarctica.AAC.1